MSGGQGCAADGWPRLRRLGLVPRLGVGAVVLVVLGGIAASVTHVYQHYQNRDESPGLTLDDIRAAYRGLTTTSALLGSLQRGHPETMKAADREALVNWLTADRVAENYDNMDLGDRSPAELIAANCLACHSRKTAATAPGRSTILLDYWTDLKEIAVSRRVSPMDRKIMVASTHAHALAMGSLTAVVAGLLLMTSWARALIGLFIGVLGVSLLADLGSWWLASQADIFTYVIAGAGAIYNGGMVLACLLVIGDLLMPRPRA